jgi:hypothetical protein
MNPNEQMLEKLDELAALSEKNRQLVLAILDDLIAWQESLKEILNDN